MQSNQKQFLDEDIINYDDELPEKIQETKEIEHISESQDVIVETTKTDFIKPTIENPVNVSTETKAEAPTNVSTEIKVEAPINVPTNVPENVPTNVSIEAPIQAHIIDLETTNNKVGTINQNNKIISSNPILEVRETERNPYEKRYNPPKKDKKKKVLKQDIAVKKLISISQKNIEVVDVLKKISKDYPSESEFICQAIIEKYKRETEIKETNIKELVKLALSDLIGEKYIIMKGSQDIQVSQNYIQENSTKTIINQDSIDKAISTKEKNEKEDLLLSMMDDLED